MAVAPAPEEVVFSGLSSAAVLDTGHAMATATADQHPLQAPMVANRDIKHTRLSPLQAMDRSSLMILRILGGTILYRNTMPHRRREAVIMITAIPTLRGDLDIMDSMPVERVSNLLIRCLRRISRAMRITAQEHQMLMISNNNSSISKVGIILEDMVVGGMIRDSSREVVEGNGERVVEIRGGRWRALRVPLCSGYYGSVG